MAKREKAQKALDKANDKLDNETKKYQKLEAKGKLSPNDIEKWEEKLEKLRANASKAQQKANKL